MKLEYSGEAVKQLHRLPTTEQKKALKKIVSLSLDPYCGKQLKGELSGLRSLRAWPYRIIYRLDDNGILIISITHRQGAYR